MAKLNRACPALGRNISAVECGEGRHSLIPCPAGCRFDSFAPEKIDQVFQLEAKLEARMAATFSPARAEGGESADPGPGSGGEPADAPDSRGGSDAEDVEEFLSVAPYALRDEAGLSFADHWDEANGGGLRNDERVLLRALRRVRPALLEIHRVSGPATVEGVDLFTGERMTVVHEPFAQHAVRFSTVLTWAYPLPHFWVVTGLTKTASHTGCLPALEVCELVLRHLAAPEAGAARAAWIAEHYPELAHAVEAAGFVGRYLADGATDLSNYQYHGPLTAPTAEVVARLDEDPRSLADPLTAGEEEEGFSAARLWLKSAEGAPADPALILGRVLCQETELVLESSVRADLERLAVEVGARLGELVRIRPEVIEGPPWNEVLDYEETLIPEELITRAAPGEASPTLAAALRALHPDRIRRENPHGEWGAVLDEPSGPLGARTPREAAKIPELRPILAAVLKARIHEWDLGGRESGCPVESPDWALEELGFPELILPPPPPAPPKSDEEPTSMA